MQIQPTNNYSQSFKGLNFTNVSTVDRELFIRGNMKKLKELGEKYDIRITSCYDSKHPYAAFVDIDVMPLRAKLSFFKKIFRLAGNSSYMTEETEAANQSTVKKAFMSAVNEAVDDLGKKTLVA